MNGSKKPKADDFTLAWRNILRYIGKYRYAFVLTALMSAIGTVLTLIGPYYISDMTDVIEKGLSGPMDMKAVEYLAAVLFAIYIGGGLLTFVENYLMATVSQRSAQMFRRDVSRKMNRIPLRYFDQSSKGDVMSRVTNDVDTLGSQMNQCIGSVVTAVTTLCGATLLMVILNIPLALLTIAVAGVGFAIVKGIARSTQKYFKSQQENLGLMNGLVEEQYSGHTIVTVYAGRAEAQKRFDELNDHMGVTAFRSQFLGGISSHLSGLISNVGYVLVCLLGSFLYMDGRITFGVIVAFMIYVKLFSGAFSQLSYAVVSMQSVAAAAERVFAFLDYEEMEPDEENPDLHDVQGRVVFDDVRFGYDRGNPVIDGFSATVEPGQKVAIVGPTGAGKTTIINLLMRFYEVDSGRITIDGIPVDRMSRTQLRDLFGMVLQDSWMFQGTLRENIAFNLEGVTDEDLDRVCQAVGLHHFVSSLPQGYDTPMDEEGSLSEGQRQQITIARAMLGKPRMVILDEATSSVDPLTEKHIQDATESMMKGRTSFIIAHRLSTIVDSDLIIVLDKGRIVESGTHSELLSRGGFYKDLYDSQFDVAE